MYGERDKLTDKLQTKKIEVTNPLGTSVGMRPFSYRCMYVQLSVWERRGDGLTEKLQTTKKFR